MRSWCRFFSSWISHSKALTSCTETMTSREITHWRFKWPLSNLTYKLPFTNNASLLIYWFQHGWHGSVISTTDDKQLDDKNREYSVVYGCIRSVPKVKLRAESKWKLIAQFLKRSSCVYFREWGNNREGEREGGGESETNKVIPKSQNRRRFNRTNDWFTSATIWGVGEWTGDGVMGGQGNADPSLLTTTAPPTTLGSVQIQEVTVHVFSVEDRKRHLNEGEWAWGSKESLFNTFRFSCYWICFL